MMQLPFLIRGTKEWDNREYLRYLQNCKVMSFGPLTPEIVDAKRPLPVTKRIREHLAIRGVSPVKIEKFVSNYRLG